MVHHVVAINCAVLIMQCFNFVQIIATIRYNVVYTGVPFVSYVSDMIMLDILQPFLTDFRSKCL